MHILKLLEPSQEFLFEIYFVKIIIFCVKKIEVRVVRRKFSLFVSQKKEYFTHNNELHISFKLIAKVKHR